MTAELPGPPGLSAGMAGTGRRRPPPAVRTDWATCCCAATAPIPHPVVAEAALRAGGSPGRRPPPPARGPHRTVSPRGAARQSGADRPAATCSTTGHCAAHVAWKPLLRATGRPAGRPAPAGSLGAQPARPAARAAAGRSRTAWPARLPLSSAAWSAWLPPDLLRTLQVAHAIAREEGHLRLPGPGPAISAGHSRRRPAAMARQPFPPTPTGWPNAVLIAKSVAVWLDQLGRRYAREIRTLDGIPDAELDRLAGWGLQRPVADRYLGALGGLETDQAAARQPRSRGLGLRPARLPGRPGAGRRGGAGRSRGALRTARHPPGLRRGSQPYRDRLGVGAPSIPTGSSRAISRPTRPIATPVPT